MYNRFEMVIARPTGYARVYVLCVACVCTRVCRVFLFCRLVYCIGILYIYICACVYNVCRVFCVYLHCSYR